jgi:soluble lytic murein transglycosylase
MLSMAGCNMQSQPLPTVDESGNIIITATAPLPTANAEGVIVITATPDGGANTLPATATLLPPTVTPTPLPDPRALLQQADQLLRNGYLEEAVYGYQAVLNQGDRLDAVLRGEAAFRLGQAAVREGLFTEAVTALSTLISELPGDSHAGAAYFLRGDAYLGLSQWQQAIADFQQYLLLRPGLIDSYTHERIADAYLALGQVEQALAAYEQALAANRTLVPQLLLREKVAQIYISLGRVPDAVVQYDAILEVARNAPYRASIDLAAAKALLNAGLTESALGRARRVFDSYPDTAPAYEALQMLLSAGQEIDGYRRGLVLFQYGDYVGAVDAFNEYTSNFQLAAIPANLYLQLGRSYREIGNPQAAIVAFQTIIEQYPGDALFGTALLDRGRTYFLAGDYQQAIATYLEIADRYGALADVAAEALWRAGYLYGTQLRDFVRSRETFLRLANSYPNSTWSISGLQIAASSAAGSGDTAVAENLYGRLATISSGEDQAAAFYWVGRLARQRGDTRTSDEAFQRAREAAPDSFFAQRAADIVQGIEPFTAPPTIQFEFDEAAERSAAEDWLRTTFGIQQNGDLHTLSAELAADGRLIRGQELWMVAAYSEALNEFTNLLDESRTAGDVLRSYQMAHYLRALNAYQPSIVAAADVIVASGQPTLTVPRLIARMRYPAYYADLVVEQAGRYGFDPLLMLALMRQESLFNATATSSANARGLTQVIPSTALYIAEQLSWADFQDRDLYRPYVSVAFGAYYLDEQLRLFNGNRAAALAAYNAGPGYTSDWVTLSGGDVDSLVSTITFEETRRYIQRIYSHYNMYRELYRGS